MIPPPSEPTSANILTSIPPNVSHPHYLIFYASPTERGRPWCRDCEAAEEPVGKKIKESESTVVFVGDREEWMAPENPYRQPPFSLERIPTIIKIAPGEQPIADKVQDGKRIVEADILEGSTFKAFLSS